MMRFVSQSYNLRRLSTTMVQQLERNQVGYTTHNDIVTVKEQKITFRRYFHQSTPTLHSKAEKKRADPFARRPNQKCDPYGQGGQPLSKSDAERLLLTVNNKWQLIFPKNNDDDNNNNSIKKDIIILSSENDNQQVPIALTRTFYHRDFLSGSDFVKVVSAVAQMNDHFPCVTLERQLLSKQKAWQVVTTVKCRTIVLEGLSHHDFFIATLIDVETERPEVRSLLLDGPDEI